MAFKRYADDYENEVTVDEKGRETKSPVYHGKYFEITFNSISLPRFKKNCILLTALTALLHVAAGFAANMGMNQFYVAVPYVLAFFPMVYTAAGALRLPGSVRRFKRDEIGLSFDRMRNSNILVTLALGTGLLGEIIYLISGIKDRNFSKELLFFTPEVLALLAAYLLMRLQSKVQVNASSSESQQS